MRSAADLHSQIASIVEVLANAAVAEICKAVEDEYAAVNVEMSRGQRENECLRRRVKLLELQVSRYRAEQRLKAQDGAGPGRLFPGVRLLQHRHGTKDAPAGSSLQIRPRFLNRPQQKSHTDLDQDPDQEVVTTTKTEPTEPEEDDIIIVKVEGSVSLQDNNNNNKSSTPLAQTSEIQAQSSSRTEVSGSQNFTEKPQGNVAFCHGDKTKTCDKNTAEMSSSSSTSTNETVGTFCGASASFSSGNTSTNHLQPTNFRSNVNISHCNFKNPSQSNLNGQTFTGNGLGIKPFACSKCPKRFFLEPELTKHLKSHLKQKYTCELCGKGFVCRSQLEIHQNVHTGERPFSCSVCNSWFSHPSNLQRHMKKKHLQKDGSN